MSAREAGLDLLTWVNQQRANGVELYLHGGKLKFRGPKEALTSDVMAQLRANKDELHALLSGEFIAANRYPLSYSQQAIYMLYRLVANNPAYNTVFVSQLRHDVDFNGLRAAYDIVASRHPMFNTRFGEDENGAWQQVLPITPQAIAQFDASSWSEEKLQQWIAQESDAPFNLATDSPFRFSLVSGHASGNYLIVTVHHIGADLWTLLLIADELQTAYRSIRTDTPITAPAATFTYRDHVQKQREYLASPQGLRDWQFWQQRLADMPALLPLPLDFVRSDRMTLHGARVSVALDVQQVAALREFCKQQGLTPFMLVHAALQLTLHRLTQARKFVIGTPTAGRIFAGSEQVIGDFANPVALCADFDRTPTGTTLLAWVRRQIVSALEHQAFPFPELIGRLQPARDLRRSPLFQVMYVWHQAHPQSQLALQEESHVLVTDVLPISGPRGAPYDLMLAVTDEPQKIVFNLSYNSALFRQESIATIGKHLIALLEQLIENPQLPVAQFRLPALVPATAAITQQNSHDYAAVMALEPSRLLQCSGLRWADENGNDAVAAQRCHVLIPLRADTDIGVTDPHFLYRDAGGRCWFRAPFTLRAPLSLPSLQAAAQTPALYGIEYDAGYGFVRFAEGGHYSALNIIERQVMQITGVRAAIARGRWRQQSEATVLLYLVLDRPRLLADVDELLQDLFAKDDASNGDTPRIILQVLPRLPLDTNGNLDEAQLATVPFWSALPQSGDANELLDIVVQYDEISRLYLPDHGIDASGASAAGDSVNASLALPANVPLAYADGGELVMPADAPRTLTEAFLRTARESTSRLIFIDNDGNTSDIGYDELLSQAKCVAAGLRQQGLQRGDYALLQIQGARSFFPVFWGCVLSGVIPVTIAVPDVYDLQNGVARKVFNVWKSLPQCTLIASDTLITGIQNLFAKEKAQYLPLSRLQDAPALADAEIYSPTETDVIFLQLTSGSTGTPKCIQETHRGIVAHIHGSAQFNGYDSSNISLNWLPMDHVVPILTTHLKDCYLGTTQIQLPTAWVLQQPLRWLDMIDRYRVTHTWAPNFAFRLINLGLRTNSHAGHWDLRCVQQFMNAGEQVSDVVIVEFTQLLERFGLSPHTMQPAFGMAECCTCMTYRQRFDAATPNIFTLEIAGQKSRPFVDLGGVMPGVEIRIVDADNQLLPEGIIGRFQMRGAVVTPGYLNNDKANAESLVGDGWFNSGDLGFIRDGHLALTGREKETIVVYGANHYCYEIEEQVGELPAVRPTFVAATGVYNPSIGTDELVLFYVPQKAFADSTTLVEEANEIAGWMATSIGLRCSYVIPVQTQEFPKTTSGKIQRLQLKTQFIAGQYRDFQRAWDLHHANDKTLPRWFYQPRWIEAATPMQQSVAALPALVLHDDSEAALAAVAGLQRRVALDHCVAVNALDAAKVQSIIAAHNADPLRSLIIVTNNETDSLTLLPALQILHVLLQSPLRLLWLRQGIVHDDFAATALAQSLAAEQAQCSATVIANGDAADQGGNYLWHELTAQHRHAVVRYRNGARQRRVIETCALPTTVTPSITGSALKTGGVYIVTGASGGIGKELIRFLQQTYQARLILVGRSQPAIDPTQNTVFVSVDIADGNALQQAVAKARQQLGLSADIVIDGAFHLAGVTQHAQLNDVVIDSVAAQLAAKIDGTSNLIALLSTQAASARAISTQSDEKPLLVNFSSVNGIFGGNGAGIYSLANARQIEIAEANAALVRSYTLAWTQWHGTGMSEAITGAQLQLAERSGYMSIAPMQGLQSLDLVLRNAPGVYLVGINGRIHASQMQMAGRLPGFRPIVVADAQAASREPASALALNMRYLAQLDEDERARFLRTRTGVAAMATALPSTSDARQRSLLSAALQTGELAIESSAAFVAARNDTEIAIQKMWRDVLGRDVSVTASFFEAGGDSLSAMQVISRLQAGSERALSVADLFANPSIAQLAQLIDSKSDAGAPHAGEGTANLPVQAFARDGDVALSASQNRIWFLQQFTGDIALWNVVIPLKVTGDFAVADVQRAVNAVIDRHEIFSCRVVLGENGPVHRVVEKQYPAVNVHDIVGGFEALDVAAKIQAGQSFDLRNDLLLRVDIFSSESSPTRIVQLATHHIISDGWSLANLVSELVANFSGQLLQPLPLQYLDFVQSERGWLQALDQPSSAMSQQLQYWREQLRGIPSQLAFFTDQPRPTLQTWGGAEQFYELPSTLSQQLGDFCREQQLTPFMVLMSAYSLLLSRYCRESDVVVGTPIANRAQQALEPLIGLFMNTLAIRTRVDDDDSVAALLSQVRQTTLDAYRHQQLPFEKLVELLAPQRDLGHSPIFQHMLIVQNAPLGRLQLPGMDVEPLVRPSSIAKFDMTMQWHQLNERWHCAIEFNTALFAPVFIDTLFRHFCQLLSQMLATPQAKVAQLNVLAADEIAELRNQLAHPGSEYARSLNLFACLQQHAESIPDAIAVQCNDTSLSYAALHRKVMRLGGLLQSLHVQRGDLVGVALQRNENLPAVLLAIHAVGATYVPLDPDYPEERIRYMIEHCQPRLLLTDTRSEQKNAALSPNGDQQASAQRCNLDECWSRLGDYCVDDPQLQCAPNQLAYVIYTSGSTGKPKGVQVYNHSLANFLYAMASELDVGADEKLLAVTSLSFDIAALELFLPLLKGSTVVIATREQAQDGSQLCGLIEQHAVTALQATPATWHLLLDAGWNNASSSRFLALCGGEPMPVGLARQLLNAQATLFNVYGPTETTVWSTLSRIDDVVGSNVDIGHAIANTQLYILDEYRNPVPRGAAGELYIGGDGVSAGYLAREDLTQAAFVNAAQLPDAGVIYKTGDLVRLGFDGKLHCLGRIDNQVKLRGFRIELAEIETVLLSLPGVSKAVALLSQDRSNLLAVVECAEDADIDVERIAQHGKAFLPAYMVPSRVFVVDALPLTPNGKIDRRAVAELPQLSQQIISRGENVIEPRSPLEQEMLALWQPLVAVRGVTDNFFENGGHSLLAAQLAQRIEKQFGVRYPTLSMFQAPTVADAVAQVESLRLRAAGLHVVGGDDGSGLHQLQKGTGVPLLLMYGVDGSLHHYRGIIDALPHASIFGLEMSDEDLDLDLPARAQKYAALVVQALPAGIRELTVLGWSFGGVLAHAMVPALAAQGVHVRQLVMLDSYVGAALPMHGQAIDESLLLAAFAVDLGVDVGFAMGLSSQPVASAKQRLLQMLHDAGLTPATFEADQLQQAFTRFSANHRALQQYQPHLRPVATTLIRATANPLLAQAPANLGWQSLEGSVNIVDTACDHYAVVTNGNMLNTVTGIMQLPEL